MGRKLLKTVQTIILLFGILSRTPWEPVADPLWSADPSLKTADLGDMLSVEEMLMQLWRPELELVGISSGSWSHCLPIRTCL